MGKGAGAAGDLLGDDLFAMMGMKRFSILDEPEEKKAEPPKVTPPPPPVPPKVVVDTLPTSESSVRVSLSFR